MNSIKFQPCDTTHFPCCQILLTLWFSCMTFIFHPCVSSYSWEIHDYKFTCHQFHPYVLFFTLVINVILKIQFGWWHRSWSMELLSHEQTITFVWSIWSINIFHQSSNFMHTTNYMCDKLHSWTLLIYDDYN
jgi:hypothetical protein